VLKFKEKWLKENPNRLWMPSLLRLQGYL